MTSKTTNLSAARDEIAFRNALLRKIDKGLGDFYSWAWLTFAHRRILLDIEAQSDDEGPVDVTLRHLPTGLSEELEAEAQRLGSFFAACLADGASSYASQLRDYFAQDFGADANGWVAPDRLREVCRRFEVRCEFDAQGLRIPGDKIEALEGVVALRRLCERFDLELKGPTPGAAALVFTIAAARPLFPTPDTIPFAAAAPPVRAARPGHLRLVPPKPKESF